MGIALPSNEVFETNPTDYEIPNDLAGAASQDIVDTKLYCPSTGGMFVKIPGELFPRKGLCYPDAAMANTIVKRVLLAWLETARNLGIWGFIFRRNKVQRVQAILERFNWLAISIYKTVKPVPYLKFEYYTEFSRAIWILSEHILLRLGIQPPIAKQTGKHLATMLEYEDAYRFALKDVFAELQLEEVRNHPQQALNKVIILIKQRSIGFETHKFITSLRLLKLVLFLPKIKRAFVESLAEIKFEDLQADANDRFWCLIRTDWLFGGLPPEQRKLQLLKEDYNPDKFVWRKVNYMSEEQTETAEVAVEVPTQPEQAV